MKKSSFTDIIISSDSINLTNNILNSTISNLIDIRLLKEIPIISTLYSTYKLGLSITDYLFANKVYSFLFKLVDIDIAKREKMIDKIDKSKKYRTKVGDKILYLLEKADDAEMASLIAILFKAVLKEDIDYKVFLELVKVLNSIGLENLREFMKYDDSETFENIDYFKFIIVGIVTLHDIKTIRDYDTSLEGTSLQTGVFFPRINQLGKDLKKTLSQELKD